MSNFKVNALSHVNVTVPAQAENAAKNFYETVLGLERIPKPDGPRKNVGAWYQLGAVQLHLSVEDGPNAGSEGHVCYSVEDIDAAELHFRNCGVEIIDDPRPTANSKRFYIRDPGGNLIEIAS